MAEVITALGSGSCRQVRVVHLWGTGMGPGAGQALLRALEGGACPHLEDLDIANNQIGDGFGIGLVEAIQRGGCKRLRLFMKMIGLKEVG